MYLHNSPIPTIHAFHKIPRLFRLRISNVSFSVLPAVIIFSDFFHTQDSIMSEQSLDDLMNTTFHLAPAATSEHTSPQDGLLQLASFQIPPPAQQQSTYHRQQLLSSPLVNPTFTQAPYSTSHFPSQVMLAQPSTPLAGHSQPPAIHQQTAPPADALFQIPTQPYMLSQSR